MIPNTTGIRLVIEASKPVLWLGRYIILPCAVRRLGGLSIGRKGKETPFVPNKMRTNVFINQLQPIRTRGALHLSLPKRVYDSKIKTSAGRLADEGVDMIQAIRNLEQGANDQSQSMIAEFFYGMGRIMADIGSRLDRRHARIQLDENPIPLSHIEAMEAIADVDGWNNGLAVPSEQREEACA